MHPAYSSVCFHVDYVCIYKTIFCLFNCLFWCWKMFWVFFCFIGRNSAEIVPLQNAPFQIHSWQWGQGCNWRQRCSTGRLSIKSPEHIQYQGGLGALKYRCHPNKTGAFCLMDGRSFGLHRYPVSYGFSVIFCNFYSYILHITHTPV